MVFYKVLFCSFAVVFLTTEIVADSHVETNEIKPNTNETNEIWCYQCNSVRQKECLDIETSHTSSLLYKKCPQFEEANITETRQYFCRKIVQIVMTEDDEERRIIRTCGWVKQDKPCYKITNPAHKEIVCACYENACNTAPAQLSPFSYVLLLSVAFLSVKLIR